MVSATDPSHTTTPNVLKSTVSKLGNQLKYILAICQEPRDAIPRYTNVCFALQMKQNAWSKPPLIPSKKMVRFADETEKVNRGNRANGGDRAAAVSKIAAAIRQQILALVAMPALPSIADRPDRAGPKKHRLLGECDMFGCNVIHDALHCIAVYIDPPPQPQPKPKPSPLLLDVANPAPQVPNASTVSGRTIASNDSKSKDGSGAVVRSAVLRDMEIVSPLGLLIGPRTICDGCRLRLIGAPAHDKPGKRSYAQMVAKSSEPVNPATNSIAASAELGSLSPSAKILYHRLDGGSCGTDSLTLTPHPHHPTVRVKHWFFVTSP